MTMALNSIVTYPLQNPIAGLRTIDNLPLTQLILGGSNGATDAQVAVTSLKGRNAYEQSSTDKPGSALVLSGGIGRRKITIVDATLIDGGVDTVVLALTSISTGSIVTTTTTITAGTGWTVFTNNTACAADLATYINTLGLSVTASAASGVVYLAPKPDLIAFTLTTTMAAGEGTVTSGTDGRTLVNAGSYPSPGLASTIDPNTGFGFASNTIFMSIGGSNAFALGSSIMNVRVPRISMGSGGDETFIGSITTDSFRHGSQPSASPLAQTVTIGEASRPGTDTDVAGSSGTLRSGLGTGTGAASSLIFQTPTLAGAGSGVQSYTTRLTLSSIGVTVQSGASIITQPDLNFSAAPTTGFSASTNAIFLMKAGVCVTSFGVASNTGQLLGSSIILGWSSSTPDVAAADLAWRRIGAGIVGLDTGTAAAGATLEMYEQTAPAAGATNSARIFAVDSGGGKTVLKVQFATGAAQVIATEP